MRTGGIWVQILRSANLSSRTDDSCSDKFYSFHATNYCFDDCYFANKPVV